MSVTLTRPKIKLKRVYEPAHPSDGYRVLVDRFWPCRITKGQLAADYWAREVGPSQKLRHLLAHHPNRWKEFYSLYRRQLRSRKAKEEIRYLGALARNRNLCFPYRSKEKEHNNAIVLKQKVEREAARLDAPT